MLSKYRLLYWRWGIRLAFGETKSSTPFPPLLAPKYIITRYTRTSIHVAYNRYWRSDIIGHRTRRNCTRVVSEISALKSGLVFALEFDCCATVFSSSLRYCFDYPLRETWYAPFHQNVNIINLHCACNVMKF